VNDEVEGILKEAAVAKLIFFFQICRETKEKYEKPQSTEPASQPRFEPDPPPPASL
jgi:hypothetical protein